MLLQGRVQCGYWKNKKTPNNANGGFGFAFARHVLLLSVIARPPSAVIPSQSGRLSGQVPGMCRVYTTEID